MYGAAAVQMAINIAEMHARQHEEKLIMKMPIEHQHAAWKALMERREKQRLEAVVERRHRELCESIERAGENARPRSYDFPGLFL
jgi:hypothetical protein